MEGTPFGRYRLVELLGRGGMGEVWRAFDTTFERIVALKVLPAHLSDDSVFQARFRREARVAAALNEPHVVPIHDFGEIDGRLYVTMRLIEGHDLQALIGGGPLPPAHAVAIVEQVAEALSAAHEVGLVHRDVKPSNILIAENDFAYLIDFGIARAAADTSLTGTGSAIGTWAYMAPERFTTGGIDARSDVYGLTCVLYQALTGYLPFPGDSLEQQIAGHMFAPVPQPTVRRREVPTQLDQVVARGMAKDPQDRYSTARELAIEARAALTNQLPPERPAASPTVTPPSPSPRPASEFAAPAVRPKPAQPAPPNQPRVAPRPSQPAKSGVGWAVPVLAVGMIAALGLAGWAALRPTPTLTSAPIYTDAQRATAKTQICAAWTTVSKGVSLNTKMTPPGGDADVTGALAVASNARLSLIGGGQYLLTRLDPATAPELADAVRKFANNLLDIGIAASSGTENSDPTQAARLKETDEMNGDITRLCA